MQEIFIARQPVYNRELGVIGYELLFRAHNTDVAEIGEAGDATSRVLLNSFINIGFDRLVGSSLAFINVPEALLLKDALLPMPTENVVLELLEDVEPRPEVIAGVKRLRQRGFRIALDDFIYRPDYKPLLELADYAKVDVLAGDPGEIESRCAPLRQFPLQLIAEKVETHEMYRLCLMLGFDCYQGYFFCRPETLRNRTPAPNKTVVLSLLQQLSNPDLAIRKLEATLANDVSLTYKLLRYVNSAAFGMRREIESLKDAIVLAGFDTIRNWAALILLNSIRQDKPEELIRVAMIRARMCEQLAVRLAPAISGQMFITGLFSVLDAIMDMDLATLLDDLPLSAPIKFALLSHEGVHGSILQQVLCYEQGEWDALTGADIDKSLITASYLEALHWADTSMQALLR